MGDLQRLISVSAGYVTNRLNFYWFGGRREPGTGNPGTWNWDDGTDFTFTYVSRGKGNRVIHKLHHGTASLVTLGR